MILYFADRLLNIEGTASTKLPKGFVIVDDEKAEDVDSGVSSFECKIKYAKENRSQLEAMTEVGNYLLKKSEEKDELYTIIDAEIDTKKQTAYIYAEDAGLDLLNDIAEAYEADQEYPIEHYIDRYAAGAGWEIGINELEGIVKKLSFDNEETTSARLLKIAQGFNDCEISFSFDIDGLKVKKKYINIYEERGKNTDVQLRLNKEIDSIVITKTISGLATALKAKGGTPANAKAPVTLLNYVYDDGDFYVDGDVLKSRKAFERWRRCLWKDEDTQQIGGHIVKTFSYETTSQAVLCEKTVEELKKICDMEVNYEVEIKKLPDNVRVGDRVNVIDDNGELYLSTRLLALKYSEVDQERKAVLGENFLKGSGISQKVADLAAQFAINAHSAQKALEVANSAKESADSALEEAEKATGAVQDAVDAAEDAKDAADKATESANQAASKADDATEAVGKVQQSVAGLQQTIDNANQAAQNAHSAAQTATQKAEEAKTAAGNAQKKAEEAANANSTAQTKAAEALEKATEATATAGTAKAQAQQAAAIANAAKRDAEQAEADIAEWEESLQTVTDTMSAEYSRKTDLTEATESLQSQISRNAVRIAQNISATTMIDETANNALTTVQAAQKAATEAQQQADEASAIADEAQIAANTAQAAATAAQNEADTAQAAYETAKQVADKAEADLKAAEEDLATVAGRVDATEEEIAEAQQAVDDAQAAADSAKSNAKSALATATAAQEEANAALDTATKAQANADKALNEAAIAQEFADKAKDDATAAQNKVTQAQATATVAKTTADKAKANAEAAQATADQAALDAITAQQIADDAQAKATKAATDLTTAQQNLSDVLANVGATEEAVAKAYADVDIAQAKATEAQTYATTAQTAADNAKTQATQAQTAADTAKATADAAQAEAKAAQDEVDKALGLVYSLEKRVTTAETGIEQTKSELRLFAKKEEVIKTLGNYYTKVDTEAAIELKSDEIKNTVSETHLTKEDFNSEKAEITQAVSEVSQKADAFDIKFTNKAAETENEMQTKFSEIYKNFNFSENGLVIGGGKNVLALSLDNDNGIMFSKNGLPFGMWDGEDFYTGNIVVAVNKRAQFGNFAFVPRTSGSLSFLKVKGINGSNVEHSHNYSSSTTQAATCTQTGIRGYMCACGESYTETIPALGHNYTAVVTPPTTSSGGYTTYTCTRCGDSYVGDYTGATPKPTYTIGTAVTPSGSGTVDGGGNYVEGTTVNLIARPASGYRFKQWNDGTTNATKTIVVSGNATYTATFELIPTTTEYTITTSVSPAGAGTVTGGGTYESGSAVTLRATPASGYSFKQWKISNSAGMYGDMQNPLTLTANTNYTVTAVFEAVSSGGGVLTDGDRITEGVEASVEIPTKQSKVLLEFKPKNSGSYTFESLDQVSLDPDGYIYGSDKETILISDRAGSKGFSCTYDNFVAGETYYLAAELWSGTGTLKVKVSYNGSGGSSGGGSGDLEEGTYATVRITPISDSDTDTAYLLVNGANEGTEFNITTDDSCTLCAQAGTNRVITSVAKYGNGELWESLTAAQLEASNLLTSDHRTYTESFSAIGLLGIEFEYEVYFDEA